MRKITYIVFTFFLFDVKYSNALFQDLPWVVRKLFAQDLINFYSSINDAQETTLIKAFKLSRGDKTRASMLIQQFDPILYKYYSQVFPIYYSKVDSLSPETHNFYKNTVVDKIKLLIREGAYQHDVYKHFAVINKEWEKLSETGKAELTRAFPNVSQYLDSLEFKSRALLGADYD